MNAKTNNAGSKDDASGDGETNRRHDGVCGIVMPIAAMGDHYTEEHWRRVKQILQRAIQNAGMLSQLVWEKTEIDVIQSAILHNIYENDVVICDVSALNPNVMLETGLRLSTKRPTIIITDKFLRPPFDISTIGYVEYQRDLEYNSIDDFITTLSRKIREVHSAYKQKTYKSFVENFKFETITPSKVSLTTDEFLKDRFDYLFTALSRLERQMATSSETRTSPGMSPSLRLRTSRELGNFEIKIDPAAAVALEAAIDEIPGIACYRRRSSNNVQFFTITSLDPSVDRETVMKRVMTLVRDTGVGNSSPSQEA